MVIVWGLSLPVVILMVKVVTSTVTITIALAITKQIRERIQRDERLENREGRDHYHRGGEGVCLERERVCVCRWNVCVCVCVKSLLGRMWEGGRENG